MLQAHGYSLSVVAASLGSIILLLGNLARIQPPAPPVDRTIAVAVYQEVLRDLDSAFALVVQDSTTNFPWGSAEPYLHRTLGKRLARELTNAFDAQQERVAAIPARQLDPRLEVVGHQALDSIPGRFEAFWEHFQQRYPGRRGIVSLGPIAMAGSGSTAITYVVFSCGSLCAHGALVVLKGSAHGWRIIANETIWVS